MKTWRWLFLFVFVLSTTLAVTVLLQTPAQAQGGRRLTFASPESALIYW